MTPPDVNAYLQTLENRVATLEQEFKRVADAVAPADTPAPVAPAPPAEVAPLADPPADDEAAEKATDNEPVNATSDGAGAGGVPNPAVVAPSPDAPATSPLAGE